MPPADVVTRFVAAINDHDVDRMLELVTPDHRLIDSLGQVVDGLDRLRQGWRMYFEMVPDYWITVERQFAADGEIVLFGEAGGTFSPDGRVAPENAWRTPVAWRATIEGGLVAVWRVYADNEPLRARMRAATAGRA
jgi:uncharacterized protein (TIGR02246 family)